MLNGQTAVAAVMAIIYTPLLQYALESIFVKVTEASLSFCPIDSRCIPRTVKHLVNISDAVTGIDATVRDSDFSVSEIK